MKDLAQLFAKQKYVVWRSCLKDPQLSLLYRYACKRADIGTMKLDGTAPGALSAAGDVFMDGLLIDLLPAAEKITQLQLFPTYSYFRVYHRGDVLALLGNSGNSDSPHLHFHVTDGNSPLGAEGVPFVFDSFEQQGFLSSKSQLISGGWKPDPKNVTRVQNEMPADNAVVRFP